MWMIFLLAQRGKTAHDGGNGSRSPSSNLGFFTPLIERMTQTDPGSRPTAEEAFQQWRTIRARVYTLHRYWRVRDSREPPLFGPILDLFYVLGSIPRVFRLLGRMLQAIFTWTYLWTFGFATLERGKHAHLQRDG